MNHLSIALTIIVVLIIMFLITYNIYLVYQHNFNQNQSKNVLILKTHVWNPELETFCNKIYHETKISNVKFFILMHSNDYSLKKNVSNSELHKLCLIFAESDIKKIYPGGFYSMWLSNHWILMWFFKHYQFDYYWTMEYDVRISGNSSKIWKYSGKEDFIYVIDPFQDPKWAWRNYYTPGSSTITLDSKNKYYGYLQLARYSRKFLKYMDRFFTLGENGQDEMIIFSLYKRGKFTGSNKLLSKLVHDSWSVKNEDSDKHKQLLKQSEDKYSKNPQHLQIFHPIK